MHMASEGIYDKFISQNPPLGLQVFSILGSSVPEPAYNAMKAKEHSFHPPSLHRTERKDGL